MQIEPQKEHAWLQKLVGEWTFESDVPLKPDDPTSIKCTGSETVRSLGGLWVIAEGRGEMPGGGTGLNVMTLGYDPAQKRYRGTWIGSMMPNMWVYDGSMNTDGTALELETEGPDMLASEKISKYMDVIAFQGEDQRTLTSHTQGEDGKWKPFMTATYRRKR